MLSASYLLKADNFSLIISISLYSKSNISNLFGITKLTELRDIILRSSILYIGFVPYDIAHSCFSIQSQQE
jgi:hypothetical protein